MVIALIGGRCCGKSDLARAICDKVRARLFTGRSYMELAPSEPEARAAFRQLLEQAQDEEDYVIYIVTDRELMELLPERCLRVLCKASLKTVKTRFAAQMQEPLTAAMTAMLKKQYDSFDECPHDLRVDPTLYEPELLAVAVLEEAGL